MDRNTALHALKGWLRSEMRHAEGDISPMPHRINGRVAVRGYTTPAGLSDPELRTAWLHLDHVQVDDVERYPHAVAIIHDGASGKVGAIPRHWGVLEAITRQVDMEGLPFIMETGTVRWVRSPVLLDRDTTPAPLFREPADG